MTNNTIIIGTRGSELARTQTGMVADSIQKLTGLTVETVIIKTEGDRIQDVPLHMVDGKGFFTKELEEALLNHRIDLAVHSMKDLPTESPEGLIIAAVPPRELANDLLLVRENIDAPTPPYGLPATPVVGTSSKRRALQMKILNPNTIIKELRGNVPTRIQKLLDGGYDAILLAAAGYRRLNITPKGYRVFPLSMNAMLPAPAQGALALQIRTDDEQLNDLLAPLHDIKTALAVEAERHVLELLGGGCGMPLGVYAECSGTLITLKALLGPDNWQLHDEPQSIRAETTAPSAKEAALQLVKLLGTVAES